MPSLKTFAYQGHKLTWQEHSQGEHTFLFINGYSASQKAWTRQLEVFKDKGRCITLDLPGHYPAETSAARPMKQDDLLEMYACAVRHIAHDTSVTIIGHSTGGLIGLGVAARLPNNVKRVISINAPIWGPLSGLLGFAQWLLRHQLYPVFWAMWRFTQIAPWAMVVGVGFYVYDKRAHWQNKDVWRLCEDSYTFYKYQSLRNLAHLLHFLDSCDLRLQIAQIDASVLVITGDHDPIVPPTQARWLANHLKQGKLYEFVDVGHVPHLENAAQCEQVMLRWLEENPF